MFTIEKFSWEKHMLRLGEMAPGPVSSKELSLVATPIEDMTMAQGLCHCALQSISDETYVFIDTETKRLLGIGGIALLPGLEKTLAPWWLSTGFEKKCPKAFFTAAKALVKHWTEEAYYGYSHYNLCLNNPTVIRFLRALGYTVESETNSKLIKFYRRSI